HTVSSPLHPFLIFSLSFFFNHTATTYISTLSLHDALPIYSNFMEEFHANGDRSTTYFLLIIAVLIIVIAWINYINLSTAKSIERSEEHTSELQSLTNIVCRLLLEKKK